MAYEQLAQELMGSIAAGGKTETRGNDLLTQQALAGHQANLSTISSNINKGFEPYNQAQAAIDTMVPLQREKEKALHEYDMTVTNVLLKKATAIATALKEAGAGKSLKGVTDYTPIVKDFLPFSQKIEAAVGSGDQGTLMQVQAEREKMLPINSTLAGIVKEMEGDWGKVLLAKSQGGGTGQLTTKQDLEERKFLFEQYKVQLPIIRAKWDANNNIDLKSRMPIQDSKYAQAVANIMNGIITTAGASQWGQTPKAAGAVGQYTDALLENAKALANPEAMRNNILLFLSNKYGKKNEKGEVTIDPIALGGALRNGSGAVRRDFDVWLSKVVAAKSASSKESGLENLGMDDAQIESLFRGSRGLIEVSGVNKLAKTDEVWNDIMANAKLSAAQKIGSLSNAEKEKLSEREYQKMEEEKSRPSGLLARAGIPLPSVSIKGQFYTQQVAQAASGEKTFQGIPIQNYPDPKVRSDVAAKAIDNLNKNLTGYLNTSVGRNDFIWWNNIKRKADAEIAGLKVR